MQQFFLPKPEGTFHVGFNRFKLVNANVWDRTKDNENRAFEICVWYPGGNTDNQKTKNCLGSRSIRDLSILHSLIGEENIRSFLFDATTSAVEGVEVSERRDVFPVILFSRDLGYLPEYYIALMEHLASKGFFVFSIHHTPISNEEHIHRLSFSAKLSEKLSHVLSFQWDSDRERNYHEFLGSFFEDVFNDWQGDAKFLLDYLESINQQTKKWNGQGHDFFSARMDLNQVILMGHGFGALPFQRMLFDARISALVHLAGDSSILLDRRTVSKPALVIGTQKMNEGNHFNEKYTEHFLPELNHNSFTDLIFYEHLKNAFELEGILFSQHLIFSQIKKIIDPFIDRYSLKKSPTYLNRQIL